MPAAACGCVLQAHRTSRSAKGSPCSPRSVERNSACRRASRMWRSTPASELRGIRHGHIINRISRMPAAPSQHRLGVALVVAPAVAWSPAPFFTRLLPFDSWTILFWRGLFGGGLIAAILVLMQGRAGLRDLARMGTSGWLVASLSTLGMVSFIPALQLTSVSNVAIIIATGPFVAAAFAWIWLDEAARWRTMLASLAALCGVASAMRAPVPT